jgi:hypothetical protein
MHKLWLTLLDGTFAVCRLPADAPVPGWTSRGHFLSITRTHDELSIVCLQEAVPEDVPSEPGWRALRAEGPLAFSMVGVLASLLNPLAEAGISVFVLSTFNTDYLLVKEETLEQAIHELERAGHRIVVSGQ